MTWADQEADAAERIDYAHLLYNHLYSIERIKSKWVHDAIDYDADCFTDLFNVAFKTDDNRSEEERGVIALKALRELLVPKMAMEISNNTCCDHDAIYEELMR